MAFNIAANTYQPNYGKALLGGVAAGQNIRKNVLAEKAAAQKAQQQLQLQTLGAQYAQATGEQKQMLGQQLQATSPEYYGKILGNEKTAMDIGQGQQERQTDFLAKAAVQLENTPEAQRPQVYDRLQTMAVQKGLMSLNEVEPYSEKVMDELQAFKYQAQGIGDLTLSEKDKQNLVMKKQEKKGKVPINFSKQFNDRLEMDIEALDELPEEDVKLIRNTTSENMRQGMDFEEAYNSAINTLGLQESDAWFGEDYQLAPPVSPTATAPQEQIPTGQSIMPQEPVQTPDALARLEQIRKRRMEIEAQRNRGGI